MSNWRCTCLNEWIDNRPDFMVGSRGQGKTALLIKQAYETNGVIVCPSHHMADYVFHMAQDIGCPIIQPITYDELFLYSKGRRNKNYYFDEYGMQLEAILQRAINSFERDHVKTIIIDEKSVSQLNDILCGLKVRDMNGKKLRLKIEVYSEEE